MRVAVIASVAKYKGIANLEGNITRLNLTFPGKMGLGCRMSTCRYY